MDDFEPIQGNIDMAEGGEEMMEAMEAATDAGASATASDERRPIIFNANAANMKK